MPKLRNEDLSTASSDTPQPDIKEFTDAFEEFKNNPPHAISALFACYDHSKSLVAETRLWEHMDEIFGSLQNNPIIEDYLVASAALTVLELQRDRFADATKHQEQGMEIARSARLTMEKSPQISEYLTETIFLAPVLSQELEEAKTWLGFVCADKGKN